MKQTIFLVFVVILAVRGVTISDFMSRNPTYDNRATPETNIISTLIFRSSIQCASYCTRNDECKSIMYNMNTHFCQLLSVHMDAVSDAGPQPNLGCLYYERKIDGTMLTTTTVDVETTVVSTETTQTTFGEKIGTLDSLPAIKNFDPIKVPAIESYLYIGNETHYMCVGSRWILACWHGTNQSEAVREF
uniref:Uncharacterized protein n=1 Tax=Magallana gigas TaxID=29159 RepID=K1R2E6_MAGGI